MFLDSTRTIPIGVDQVSLFRGTDQLLFAGQSESIHTRQRIRNSFQILYIDEQSSVYKRWYPNLSLNNGRTYAELKDHVYDRRKKACRKKEN
ncbi:hypothetical protein KIN20_037300 [Parelaphostrongylus tenuis]|uniref:Uncharacterized protein n=1 Tax=Parelaphostrongylus tenuis TaxID=148309 RepID=A0AAD5WMC8_PARTN|nr:hypothetical protein KIN20_037300 [Parelaphostrongylus tenuis]